MHPASDFIQPPAPSPFPSPEGGPTPPAAPAVASAQKTRAPAPPRAWPPMAQHVAHRLVNRRRESGPEPQ